MSHGQTGLFEQMAAHDFIHSNGRGSDSGTGIGNPGQFQHALDGTVFTIFSMKGNKYHFCSGSFEIFYHMMGIIFHGNHMIADRCQCFRNGGACIPGNFCFRRWAAHKNDYFGFFIYHLAFPFLSIMQSVFRLHR